MLIFLPCDLSFFCLCLFGAKKMHRLKNKHEKTTEFTQLGLIQTPSVYLLMNKERKPQWQSSVAVFDQNDGLESLFLPFFFFFLGLDCYCRLCVVKQEVENFWL